jgi:hypothetical protein
MKMTRLVWEDGTWLFKLESEATEIAKFASKDEALIRAAGILREKSLITPENRGILPVRIENPDGSVEERSIPLSPD